MRPELVEKIKGALSQYYFVQGGRRFDELGRSIDWRLGILANLSRHKGPSEMIGIAAGLCVIQRQIEAELQQYQDQIQNLSLSLQEEEIEQDEFQDRLEDLTTAILILAFLAGSNITDEELSANAITVLQTGGLEGGEGLDLSRLPEQAQEDLNSEIAIALAAGVGLAESIESGQYEENEEGLFSRLAMWATTALGVVSLGKLFLDAATYQIWLYNPLKDHCDDCFNLNGQVHTVLEWNDFFARTGKRPQGRALLCGGWNCGCGLFNADGPSAGNFV